MKSRVKIVVGLLGVAGLVGGVIFFISSGNEPGRGKVIENGRIFVGGDIHTLTAVGEQLFVTGHEGAGMSSDNGKSWAPIPSLNNSDIMGWSQTSSGFLVGGHPGLMKSMDGGGTFLKVKPYKNVTDIHSIGASGEIVYLASPQIGLLASSDGGANWELRNSQVGQGFMGSMLVDPANPEKIIAPDMSANLLISNDAGLSWQDLGGPTGAMSVTWNPHNSDELAAIGMAGSATSKDGGKSWSQITLPAGSSAIAFSTHGTKLLVAALISDQAQLYSSSDYGVSWTNSASGITTKGSSAAHSDTEGMDPNMPGMTHDENASQDRPITVVLGTFGLASGAVIFWAALLKRKDKAVRDSQKMDRSPRNPER